MAPRVYRELARLSTYYNPTLTGVSQDTETAEIALMAVLSGGRDPLTFQEAWNHPDPDEREGWREGIRKEFHDMNKRKVWRIIKWLEVPRDRRLAGHKWVFKKKKNGVFRVRLVTLGYSQIPGIDFTENYAPVVSDITFRIVLLLAHILSLKMELIDIETAFLYGELEDAEIYMNIPEGLEYFEDIPEDSCTQLTATIYGLVQSARQFWKKLMRCLVDKLGFMRSRIDPCLLIRDDPERGICIFCSYVDDAACVGSQKAVDYVKDEIQRHFNIKKLGELTEYIGVSVTRSKDGFVLCQPDVIGRIQKYFEEDSKLLRHYETPMSAGYSVIRPKDKTEVVSEIEQQKYRSGVGSLNYLVKHSRLDLSNAVRELAKVLDGATHVQMKDLYRVIRFTLDSESKGFWINPNLICYEDPLKRWKVVAFSDSDYSGDRDTRRSVTGYAIYVNGTLICWKS